MIKINNLIVSYEKEPILKDINLCFKKGELVSIVGPNGSGKTTLLKSIIGLINNIKGEVIIDNENLNLYKRKDIAKKIAYLSQEKASPDMTVKQLVLHGRFPYLNTFGNYSEKDKEICNKALEKMGILSLADKFINTLSGGMKQTCYIAMVLAQDTDYILLDEPTTHLDISHQLKFMKDLRKLADEGKGIVVIIHDIEVALNFSDKVIVLNNGIISKEGTPSEIYKSKVIKDVFNVELKEDEVNNNHYYYKY